MFRFNQLRIATKMLLGYMPLALMIIVISVFTLLKLNNVNRINRSIVEHDMIMIKEISAMLDNLIAQDSYGRRFIILKSTDMLNLFRQRSRDFELNIARIRNLPAAQTFPLTRLERLHRELSTLYRTAIDDVLQSTQTVEKNNDETIKRKMDELSGLIQDMRAQVQQGRNLKMLKIAESGVHAYQVTIFLAFAGILIGIGAPYLITRNILNSIQKLKFATQKISAGQYDYTPEISDQNEFGELAAAFREMALRLSNLEKMHRDANPLTGLPGGIAVENTLKTRLNTPDPITFCLIDLDNFKPFNDHYGYAMGNEVIKTTARIIQGSVARHGETDDFVGHIGGDDFVIIITPEKHESICKDIIHDFDTQIIRFYSAEDRERGCILGKTRQGEEVRFPILSISIAVVTDDKKPYPLNHIEIGEIAAEVKEHAKSLPGSVFLINRRSIQPKSRTDVSTETS